MSISRRHVITSALGATAALGLGAAQQATAGAAPRARAVPAASGPGDVVGKISVGYQGWFACIGDGAPINSWWHYSQNGGQAPSPGNTTIKSWPDVSEFSRTYQTAYANLNGGGPAKLFSSWDQQTVDTHFLWMQQNGIDTAALQRFNPNSPEGPTRDGMAQKVRQAAEGHGRKFYIMYDVSGWTAMQSEIKTDWANKMKAHTASSAYATQNGRPVVCIWGFGFNDGNHDFSAGACLDVINWFKGQGCYVIGGVPTHWRTNSDDSRAGFSDVYHALNMISPWMVGRIGSIADVDNFYANVQTQDLADCQSHGIDYQPCVLPGDLQERQRAHGDFMWRQFYNMCRLGVQGIYISMYDEFNEGNQIAKTAADAAAVPSGSGIYALDEDGTACSSDYYLRLTGDGGRMLKKQIGLTATRPTPPVA
ncbi:glycoside hydrolase family 71/99-like protein [Streptomyces sp. NPDC047002]|uniref:glycoside hydrolase family 71/99-like protein n=1 Tax=Streptomyces sp. NPDC047002 TaxID=3155475 RepID=UPI003452BB0B